MVSTCMLLAVLLSHIRDGGSWLGTLSLVGATWRCGEGITQPSLHSGWTSCLRWWLRRQSCAS